MLSNINILCSRNMNINQLGKFLHRQIPIVKSSFRQFYTGKVLRGYPKDFDPTTVPVGFRLRYLVRPLAFTVAVGGILHFVAVTYRYDKSQIKSYLHRQLEYKRKMQTDPGSVTLSELLNVLPPQTKLIYSVIAANVSVFLLLKIKPVFNYCSRFLIANVYGRAPVTSMFGCMFTHVGLLHLFVNMYVLKSLSRVDMDPYDIGQVYITGGIMASLATYVRNVILPRPPYFSLGASGAILALLACYATRNDHARFSIAFVSEIYPHSFSGKQAVLALIAFDTCGLLFGWRVFDHAAHLGGTLFGITMGWLHKRRLQQKMEKRSRK